MTLSREVAASMRRWRVMAWIVGTGLLVLTVGTVLDWGFGRPMLAAIVGPIHGFLYIGYLLLTLDLTVRARWPIVRAVLIAVAGTIPFLSFVAERIVTRPLRDAASGRAAAASTAGRS